MKEPYRAWRIAHENFAPLIAAKLNYSENLGAFFAAAARTLKQLDPSRSQDDRATTLADVGRCLRWAEMHTARELRKTETALGVCKLRASHAAQETAAVVAMAESAAAHFGVSVDELAIDPDTMTMRPAGTFRHDPTVWARRLADAAAIHGVPPQRLRLGVSTCGPETLALVPNNLARDRAHDTNKTDV